MEQNGYIEILQKAKEFLQKNFSFIKVGFISKRIISIIIILISSTVAYFSGYLFLWGYYFGGEKDESLLSVAVNLVPIERVVAFSVGFFYIILIGIIVLFFIAILKNKASFDSAFLIVLALGFTNLAIVYFLAAEVTLMVYIQTLLLWLLPLFIILICTNFYFLFKASYAFISYQIYCCSTYISLIIISKYFDLPSLGALLSRPEFLMVLSIIGAPTIFLINRIRNQMILFAVKIILKSVGIIPIFLMIGWHIYIDLLAKIIFTLFVINTMIYMRVRGGKEKTEKILADEGRKKTMKPLYITKPFTVILYMLVVFFIMSNLTLYSLVQGGKYMYLILQPNNYQEIEYIWDGKLKQIQGNIISSRNDTYYISTTDRKLMILKTKDIIIGSN
ncbi:MULTISPECIES: hypothetical protein [Bacillus]|uniref:Uncharacterized protein n=1 Tax=Bacillus cereus TaxID=1396 RepID=A0A164Q9Z3_BACCE|nr:MULTISPECIES: hypothetical protein [Bacillus]KZD70430.1 hypothetical protein B4088_1168 [Bacillus cereus]TSI17333.1 hypothetical protein FOT98_10525 [Bacillus sp. HY001]